MLAHMLRHMQACSRARKGIDVPGNTHLHSLKLTCIFAHLHMHACLLTQVAVKAKPFMCKSECLYPVIRKFRTGCLPVQVDHPNCIKLENVYITPRKVYLVTELVTGGELLDRCDQQSIKCLWQLRANQSMHPPPKWHSCLEVDQEFTGAPLDH